VLLKVAVVAYQWKAIKSSLQIPAQAVKNCDSQLMPIGGLVPAPLVTAGEPICTPFPARGFMYIMWFFATVPGSMFDCEGRSGSLKERRCFEPDEIARVAAVFHEEA
jgi:hypothetical protein